MEIDKDYSFSHVFQPINISATIKSNAEDFVVEENMSIEMSGEGEHCWIYLKKQYCNTDWVAERLAKYCDVKRLAVSYAGLKDRCAVTSQWFSIQLPGLPTPEWKAFEVSLDSDGENQETVSILKCFRHNKKLQRGALDSNTFTITAKDLSDTSDVMFEQLSQRCQLIAEYGVPNYFGSQRFGRGYNNLDQALKMFNKPRFKLSRAKRGMYLSAARSWIFNFILSERITRNLWNARLEGDVFILEGKSACFKDDAIDESSAKTDLELKGQVSKNASLIEQRLDNNEIHPTAALWGDGDAMVAGKAAELESEIISHFSLYRDGLVAARVQAQRRSCRVIPRDVIYSRQGSDFEVSFTLPAGAYATVVLGEIFSQLTVSG